MTDAHQSVANQAGAPKTGAAPPAFTTGQLAHVLSGTLDGPDDITVRTIAGLSPGHPEALAFIRDAKYAGAWANSACRAALVSRGIKVPGHDASERALIVVDNADLALAALLERITPPRPRPQAGVHASAIVEPGAQVDPSAAIGPWCHVQAGARVGAGAVLASRVTLEPGAVVGAHTYLSPGVFVGARCVVGERCLVHASASIGADGFGFYPAPDGSGLVKIPHAGNVVVGNDVELGASCCVDRAKFGSTTVGDMTKVDNLVQIGHGCRVGRAVVIAAGCGIAGSVTIGDFAQVGGMCGIADGRNIGPGAQVGGFSAVAVDVPPRERWGGMPTLPERTTLRNWIVMRDLKGFVHREARRALSGEEAGQSTGQNAGQNAGEQDDRP